MFYLKRVIKILFVWLFLFMFPGYFVMCVDEKAVSSSETVSETVSCAQSGFKSTSEEFYIDEDGTLTAYNGKKQNIVIPERVKKIAFGVFMDHTEIESVVFPDGIEYIDEYAFYGCSGLTEALFPESLAKIGRLAFGNCKNLEIVYIGANVLEVGDFIFWGCDKLYCISVSDENRWFADIDGMLFSKNVKELIYCPQGYTGKVIIPDETVTIAPYAFFDCYKIEKVVMGKNVMYVDEGAFCLCKSLEEVVFGPKTKKIRAAAFERCANLKKVEIPQTVTFVGNSAFAGCDELREIKFLSKTTEISPNALSKGVKTNIIGYESSTAQKYAINHKLKFIKI